MRTDPNSLSIGICGIADGRLEEDGSIVASSEGREISAHPSNLPAGLYRIASGCPESALLDRRSFCI